MFEPAKHPHSVSRPRRQLSTHEIDKVCCRCELQLSCCVTDRDRVAGEGLWLLVLLGHATGMALRELLMLQWHQIDFGAQTVLAIDYQAVTSRTVQLNTDTIDLLRAPWPYLERYPNGESVLPFWSGSIKPIAIRRTERRLSRLLNELLEGLDITYEDVAFSGRPDSGLT